MSYASVAAHNAPPPSMQPHADPALLNTEAPSHDNIADDAQKVNIVSSDFKQHPSTATSTQDVPYETPPVPVTAPTRAPDRHRAADKARKYAHDAEEEGFYLWNVTKQYLFRPSVAGGLLGVVNVGLLSWAGYSLYTKPYIRHDTRLLATSAVAALTLVGAEGYAAEKYRLTPAGQKEEQRARQEGAVLYNAAREHILRPGVYSGLVGGLNAGVFGALAYFAYKNWNLRWDRKTVSAVTVTLLTLWSGEGYLAKRYRDTHL
ncbi:hypothetical protein PHLCEN_2v6456 [Hermanssonia centrifuga]|uniref:Mitochondrial outer membrane protein OM14 C-terminal domain-containing protein n=1 Tax=Hermanssonia centrifuga TaxID=98765 RepID=A0A2R6NZ83_9APHY|nr:hypothetical protein PHLCEN_2v6456 [Hermanssonia centrifuga]